MGDFKKLAAWQRSRALVRLLHTTFRSRRADYPGLRAQILRAAASISSNLAEGCSKDSPAELKRFATIAYGSVKEVEANLFVARDVALITARRFNELMALTDHVAKLCYGLTKLRAAGTQLPQTEEGSTL